LPLQAVSSMASFYLAMVLNPAVMKKAQAELDRVVGNQRLPPIKDRPQLPYVNAIIKEVFRWHPVFPVGMRTSSILSLLLFEYGMR
jgi:cytochrome P450